MHLIARNSTPVTPRSDSAISRLHNHSSCPVLILCVFKTNHYLRAKSYTQSHRDPTVIPVGSPEFLHRTFRRSNGSLLFPDEQEDGFVVDSVRFLSRYRVQTVLVSGPIIFPTNRLVARSDPYAYDVVYYICPEQSHRGWRKKKKGLETTFASVSRISRAGQLHWGNATVIIVLLKNNNKWIVRRRHYCTKRMCEAVNPEKNRLIIQKYILIITNKKMKKLPYKRYYQRYTRYRLSTSSPPPPPLIVRA